MYVAVILCVPAASFVVVYFAMPPLRVTVFRSVAPSSKVTDPVTVPLNCGDTVAVKVTDCPGFDGFRDDAKVIVVVALLTTWLTGFEVLAAKFESPAYTALIELVPTFRVEVEKLAEPPLKVPVPSAVVPFINVTVSPFGGVPALEETTAVKVTDCP